jgi:hypothetical protein
MTATTATGTTGYATRAADVAAHRRTTGVVGLATWAVATVFIVINAHDTAEMIISPAIAAVVAIGLFGWLLPSRMVAGAPGTALTLSVLAVPLTVVAFWSGVPVLLGVAGAMLGAASVGAGRNRSYAAVGLGALAVTGYLVLYVVVGLLMGDL